MSNSAVICFSDLYCNYPELSNLYPVEITISKTTWATAEHFFQSQKFPDNRHRYSVASAATASEAISYADMFERYTRIDWNDVKDTLMLIALKAKFSQHDDLKAMLMSTGNAVLVYHTIRDEYWGDGGCCPRDGKTSSLCGRNRLGELLMYIRSELSR
jgi:hypothetical protein